MYTSFNTLVYHVRLFYGVSMHIQTFVYSTFTSTKQENTLHKYFDAIFLQEINYLGQISLLSFLLFLCTFIAAIYSM